MKPSYNFFFQTIQSIHLVLILIYFSDMIFKTIQKLKAFRPKKRCRFSNHQTCMLFLIGLNEDLFECIL